MNGSHSSLNGHAAAVQPDLGAGRGPVHPVDSAKRAAMSNGLPSTVNGVILLIGGFLGCMRFATVILPASTSSKQGEPTPNLAGHRYPRARRVRPNTKKLAFRLYHRRG